jgi:hypothetical protein
MSVERCGGVATVSTLVHERSAKLMRQGALFKSVISHPGGYYARLSDPDENQFEIECESFCEVNGMLDPFGWPFFNTIDENLLFISSFARRVG